MQVDLNQQAIETIIEESACLDNKDWGSWLGLYTEDAVYWMPAWDNEFETTSDPKREISLIYYASRAGLEDRVYRLKTELSFASTPLPRTCHLNTNFRVSENEQNEIIVNSSWQTNTFRLRKAQNYFGLQEHHLRKTDQGLKICYRKIILQNDIVDTVLDIYSV